MHKIHSQKNKWMCSWMLNCKRSKAQKGQESEALTGIWVVITRRLTLANGNEPRPHVPSGYDENYTLVNTSRLTLLNQLWRTFTANFHVPFVRNQFCYNTQSIINLKHPKILFKFIEGKIQFQFPLYSLINACIETRKLVRYFLVK